MIHTILNQKLYVHITSIVGLTNSVQNERYVSGVFAKQ